MPEPGGFSGFSRGPLDLAPPPRVSLGKFPGARARLNAGQQALYPHIGSGITEFSLNRQANWAGRKLGDNLAYIDIIVLAGLAAFIAWRLWSVFGRREGHENPTEFGSRPSSGTPTGNDNVVPLPGARDMGGPADFNAIAPEGSDLAQGLTEVQLADRTFNPTTFLMGARQAYEMIVTAFAAGDRRELRPLLSDEVYGDFDSALRAREDEGQRVEMTFIGIDDARLTGATMRGRIAEITVKFVSEIISLTKNADGVVIEGDPMTQRKVTEVWTFARDTSSSDPNWLLIATDEG